MTLDILWGYFPYCIEKQDDGSWVLLNREYKPVGFNTREYIVYAEHPVSIRLKGLGPATIRKLWCRDVKPRGELYPDRIYLYNYTCVPTSSKQAMAAYLKKLQILFSLKVDYSCYDYVKVNL